MSMEQEPTIDDIWVNGLANRIGILTAQNDRLQIEIQQLQAQLKELQPESIPVANGEIMESIT